MGRAGLGADAAADTGGPGAPGVRRVDGALARPRPSLAAAPVGDAIRAWGRLGYPRRAVRLHGAATAITEQHGGEVPDSYDALRALPGCRRLHRLGRAGLRVRPAAGGARHQRPPGAGPGRDRGGVPAERRDRRREGRRRDLLPTDEPTAATWSVALMELGALVCTAASPGVRPARSATACAWRARRPPGVRRTAAARTGLGGDRPPVPRPADGAGSRRRGHPYRPGRWSGPGPSTAQRPRCLGGARGRRPAGRRAATATRCRAS